MNQNFSSHYYHGLEELEGNRELSEWVASLPAVIANRLAGFRHGNLDHWQATLRQLPERSFASKVLTDSVVGFVAADKFTGDEVDQLRELLLQFKPWRKGPFAIDDVHIDSEWRSDLKWDRLKDHIEDLQGRLVLDVGCGNGYHCWRMLGAGARAVIGLDPMLLYIMQFFAIKHFAPSEQVFVLPLPLEDVPEGLQSFDSVFSMGVLYHRRSPLDHIAQLARCLRPDGQLIIETLVVEGGSTTVLTPADRYARMRNVWFIPSCQALEIWLARSGFQNIKLVDVSATTDEEQRVSDWAGDASLNDFLQPDDKTKTIEGYPAPLRAIYTANRC